MVHVLNCISKNCHFQTPVLKKRGREQGKAEEKVDVEGLQKDHKASVRLPAKVTLISSSSKKVLFPLLSFLSLSGFFISLFWCFLPRCDDQ